VLFGATAVSWRKFRYWLKMLKKIGRDRSKKQLFIDTKAGNDRYYLQDVVREDDGAFTIDIAVPILLEREGKKIFIGAIL